MTKSRAITKPEDDQAKALERVLIGGDLSKLSGEQRIQYFSSMCAASGLDPVHRPFQFLELKGKTVLYLTRGGTDQLRSLRGVSIKITNRETIDDIYVVTARATIGDRSDESTGAVSIRGVKGEELANAFMKAESKAKRRATISITGLGLLDESEVLPGKAVATPEPRVANLLHYENQILDCETRPQVDSILGNAKANLDVTEMQELQTIAGDHLDSLGVE